MLNLNQFVTESNQLKSLIVEIEALNRSVELMNLPKHNVEIARRQQNLNSALYSARIEGNPLTLERMKTDPRTKHKHEIQNIEKAINWISSKEVLEIELELIKKLHEMTMKDLSNQLGTFRTEQSAIFNQAGVAIYLAPPEFEVGKLIARMLSIYQSSREHPLIRATILHYQFEKIHPFTDGNGRVGRLLIRAVMKFYKLDMQGLFGFENYIENHRQEYYSLLADGQNDLSDLAMFVAKAIVADSQSAIEGAIKPPTALPIDRLLPRRQEIVYILEDHKMITFDMLHRRFMAVPVSTLRNDLLQLQKQGIVKKLGTTKGVWYTLEN